MRHPSLLNRKRSVLVIIDVQEAFRPVIDGFEALTARVATAVKACRLLDLPIIITEQYPKGLGRTVHEIADHLAPGSDPVEKISFSACGAPEFDLRLRELHAEQVIVCGIEAHICVSQTVHDLLQQGFQVHLLSDAVATRLPHNREVGINRMASAGAIVSSIEMALFELCPAGTPEFRSMQELVKSLS